MEGFHKRYMNSNKVCRFWAHMASGLDIDMIVPQHGRPLVGKAVPSSSSGSANCSAALT